MWSDSSIMDIAKLPIPSTRMRISDEHRKVCEYIARHRTENRAVGVVVMAAHGPRGRHLVTTMLSSAKSTRCVPCKVNGISVDQSTKKLLEF
jgi:hypothetical protein